MQCYGGKDIADGFRTVRANTITIATDIAEANYGFRATPEVRSVGELLVHIALAPRFQQSVHQNGHTDLRQVNFPEFMVAMKADESVPRNKAAIVELLQTEGEAFATYLGGLDDLFLAEQVLMPPGDARRSKSRFEMLLAPKEHEMHHRGQLMLIQRLLGDVPHLTRARNERMARVTAQA